MHAPLPKLSATMPADRTRARRERRRASARRPVLHMVMPGVEVAREVPRKGETVTAFLRRTGWAKKDPQYGWQFKKHLPTVLEVNGEAVLRRQWRHTRIAANDNVRFISYPRGGQGGSTGKQVIGLVALVAVAAFAGPLGGAISSAFFGGSAIAGGIATAAIGLGGALLVNSLTTPKQGGTNAPDSTTDQIYTAQAQGNVAKLGQPLPVWYGRLKNYPDLAATPWSEFVGNDQYLNVLLSVTMGSMEYEQLLISDTPFWNPENGVAAAFSSAQIFFHEPGDPITEFPVNVSQAVEVNGQQLPHGTGIVNIQEPATPGDWIGPFVASPPGEKSYQTAIDFVYPAGCYVLWTDGSILPCPSALTVQYQEVDDAGGPIGTWQTGYSGVRSYASKSPIRDSIVYSHPLGRYQVRFRRDDGVPKDSGTSQNGIWVGASDVIWAGLRGFLQGDNVFPDVSTIGIRIKASQSTQGGLKFGVIGTRKLPVWDAESATFVLEATRNPIWTALDIASSSQYGAEVKSSKTDFNAFVNHAVAADARGDTFDYVFTSAVAMPEAIDTALTVTRSRHFWLGDTISIVRDEWTDVPSMLLTDREIIRDSTQIGIQMLGPEDADAVTLEYYDENTWNVSEVQYPPNTELFTAAKPSPKRINGIVKRENAYKEAAFWYLQSIYRRESVQIGCEYEGRAITFGQTLRVSSELPQNYGQSGGVIAASANRLTLSPAPAWSEAGPYFMRLRRPNGFSFGPVKVARGDNDNEAVLDADDLATVEGQQGITLGATLARTDGGEDPSFELGTADNQSRVVKVRTGQPNGDTFTLSLFVDDERVHATDIGTPPVLPAGQFPSDQILPLIVLLNAKFDQGTAEPMLSASWFPAAGAFYYIADVSYDGGTSWIQVYEGRDNQFSQVVTLAALMLRVQAIGKLSGPYASITLPAPTITIAPGTVAPASLQQEFKKYTQDLNGVVDTIVRAIDILSNNSSEQDLANANEFKVTRDILTKQVGDLKVSITETAAIAQDINGKLIGTLQFAVNSDGHVVSTILYNDGTTGMFIISADQMAFVSPDINGGNPIPMFVSGMIDGVPKTIFNTDIITDKTLLAKKIQTESVLALTGNFGDGTFTGNIELDGTITGYASA